MHVYMGFLSDGILLCMAIFQTDIPMLLPDASDWNSFFCLRNSAAFERFQLLFIYIYKAFTCTCIETYAPLYSQSSRPIKGMSLKVNFMTGKNLCNDVYTICFLSNNLIFLQCAINSLFASKLYLFFKVKNLVVF
jgi:hypothetical protein